MGFFDRFKKNQNSESAEKPAFKKMDDMGIASHELYLNLSTDYEGGMFVFIDTSIDDAIERYRATFKDADGQVEYRDGDIFIDGENGLVVGRLNKWTVFVTHSPSYSEWSNNNRAVGLFTQFAQKNELIYAWYNQASTDTYFVAFKDGQLLRLYEYPADYPDETVSDGHLAIEVQKPIEGFSDVVNIVDDIIHNRIDTLN